MSKERQGTAFHTGKTLISHRLLPLWVCRPFRRPARRRTRKGFSTPKPPKPNATALPGKTDTAIKVIRYLDKSDCDLVQEWLDEMPDKKAKAAVTCRRLLHHTSIAKYGGMTAEAEQVKHVFCFV